MGSIYKRGRIWWIKYYRGKTVRESARTESEHQAKQYLKLRDAQVRTGTHPGIRIERVRFDELAEGFLNDYKINGRKSLHIAEIYVRHLKEHFSGVKVVDITTDNIQAFSLDYQEEGYSNASINRHLAALQRMLRLGARETPPKVLRVPYIPMLKESNARTGFFEHDEFLALRGALPDYLKPVVTIAYYTGMRKGEILGLRWDQVNLDQRRIVLEVGTTKNNEGRVVYMTEDLWRVLSAWKRLRDLRVPNFPLVCFRMESGKAVEIGEFLRGGWAQACKHAELEGRLFHDFRRTAVRNMVRAGIPERVAMRISGHKTRAIFDRYNITSESDLKEAAGKLDAYQRSGHNLGTIESLEAEFIKESR